MAVPMTSRPPRWAMQQVVALVRREPDLRVAEIARRTGLRPSFVRVCLMAIGAEAE